MGETSQEIDWNRYLGEAEYPCGRDVLLKAAAAQGGDDEVLGQLGKLPERDYDCTDTVRTTLGGPLPQA